MAKVGYSLSLRPNPLKRNEPEKAYGTLQLNGVMDISQLAQHMSDHNSKYSRADITAVLIQCVDCMREKFIEGYKINLGDLGSFTPSISTVGAKSMDEFTSDNIKSYNIRFSSGPYLRNLKPEVDFEYVASRKAQAAVANAEKKGETNVDISKKTDTGTEGTEEQG